MEKIVIDAENMPLGRACSYAAKQALEGNEVIVINSEKAIISGNKHNILEKYRILRVKGGTAMKGPFISKSNEKLLKRTIRGMLPDYRLGRGREAWKRIRCYEGVPEQYQKQKIMNIKMRSFPIKMIKLKDITKEL